MAESTLIQQIEACTDRETLEAAIAAAQARLQQLQNGVVKVRLNGGTWYAVLPEKMPSGRNRAYKLGERLSPAAVLRRAQRKPPDPLQFEIAESEAKKSADVGWIEGPGARKRYYNVSAYQQARRRWHEWRELVTDPAAIAFGIPAEGMKMLRKLEGQGYQIQYPEQET